MPELSQKIDEARIRYESREHGVRIHGSPFVCRFGEQVDPESLLDEISTADDPWRMFAVRNQLDEDYYRASCVLVHVDNDGITDASKMDLEVAPEFMRVYIKTDQPDAERVAEFVDTLDERYGVDLEFPGSAGNGGRYNG